jgi:hypothetical protein
MGLSMIEKAKQELNSHHYEWTVVSSTLYCMKVQDAKTKIRGERYKVDLKELEYSMSNFLLRNKHQKYLVAVYDIVKGPEGGICSVSAEISVIVEDIAYRLCDLGALTLDEGLYVLTCVLKAC